MLRTAAELPRSEQESTIAYSMIGVDRLCIYRQNRIIFAWLKGAGMYIDTIELDHSLAGK